MTRGLLSITEAAGRLGITRRALWHAMRVAGIGTRIGRMWVLSQNDMRALEDRPRRGRPRKPRPE